MSEGFGEIGRRAGGPGARTGDGWKPVNRDIWQHSIYWPNGQSIQDSLPESLSQSAAANPLLNRGLPLISVALLSLGFWALIWAAVLPLIRR